MKFDVIIGNPPYQLSDGGARASAKPIYQEFVMNAIKLRPKYLSMIIPARWYAGGKGLDDFRNQMMHDNRISHITDFFDSTECFPGVDISGGICYFLWNRDRTGDCEIESHINGKVSVSVRPLLEPGNDLFIRFNNSVSIIKKIMSKHEPSFADAISARKPFGLSTSVKIHEKKVATDDVYIYAYPSNGYVSRHAVTQNKDWINKIKVCVSYAYGERGSFPYLIIGKPFIAPAGTCCSETYLVIRTCDSINEAENVISYMKTKFFRFLVLQLKNTQHATKNVYQYVPMQNFSESWTDKKLYEKYGLSSDEIEFIEAMIRPMA